MLKSLIFMFFSLFIDLIDRLGQVKSKNKELENVIDKQQKMLNRATNPKLKSRSDLSKRLRDGTF